MTHLLVPVSNLSPLQRLSAVQCSPTFRTTPSLVATITPVSLHPPGRRNMVNEKGKFEFAFALVEVAWQKGCTQVPTPSPENLGESSGSRAQRQWACPAFCPPVSIPGKRALSRRSECDSCFKKIK